MLLTRRMDFSSSHRVRLADSSHGHNYTLEVSLDGDVDPETGMVIDLKQLKDVMEAEIGTRFDHRDLNDDTPYFQERLPTAEGFAQLIFELLDAALPEDLLARVKLAPTEDCIVEVTR
ncbi:MAG: 6-carboxytetrahydropterin synthase [bacterium]|nr:6-carboxytetrahydropterin synthase [bacterium]